MSVLKVRAWQWTGEAVKIPVMVSPNREVLNGEQHSSLKQ